jgi:hypothetical protein
MQKNQKATKIKAWPDLIDYLPSLPVLREASRTEKTQKSSIEVDFGSVRAVSSTGVAVFLLRFLRFLGKRKNPYIQHDCPASIRQKLESLQTFVHLSNMAGSQEGLLIKEDTIAKDTSEKIISMPVYRLRFDDQENRRGSLKNFKHWLLKQFIELEKTYSIKTNGLIMFFLEMAKNTADHADSEGLFGMDITPLDVSCSKLSFAFGDLGIGIKQHIEQNLPPEYEQRREHMSLYEAYKLALTPGYTSNRKTGMNAGHGMSIIIDCAGDLGVDLSIFDAASRGLLSNLDPGKLSHAAVRRIFHNVGHDVGFFYFGECKLTKLKINEN